MPIHIKHLLCLALAAAFAFAGDGRVQSPDAHWKTIKTKHYRIHYPANPKGGFEPFAFEVASKIEGIHSKVAELVGFEAKGPVNVLIQDPILEANGATIPLLNNPQLVLWKTQPDPDSGIGHYDNWVDLLVTHELVHLHHLMRPKNGQNAERYWFDSLSLFNWFNPYSMIGPITLKAPRLILEGYATLLEGRITGSGRPHSAYRSAVIRQWAISGKLPDYADASSGSGFRGGSMAYLLGSAYLEWLERQHPDEPDILVKFWKQLTSKRNRNYSDCFQATFGGTPEKSYNRWRAEVTYDAMAFEQNLKSKGMIREGKILAAYNGEITHLGISPDGTKLMARILTNDNKEGIRIWDLKAAPKEDKEEKKWAEKKKGDPNEVEDRKPEWTEPKVLAIIGRRNEYLPRRAWWTGNNQITFELRQPNREGILVQSFWVYDINKKTEKRTKKSGTVNANEYTWKEIDGGWNIVKTLPDGKEQQITRTLSSAWQPAPSPDGKTLYYVSLDAYGCQVRMIDLTEPVLEPAVMPIPEPLMAPGAILSEPDSPSLLPPPSQATPAQTSYSVWDSHDFNLAAPSLSVSPATNSIAIGFVGSDALDRLRWYAAAMVRGSYMWSNKETSGPRGFGLGLMYRGWRLAQSLQAFSSLEKPSKQRFAPIDGFDRERQGAELAFTWDRKGLAPIAIKPFAAYESIKGVEQLGPQAADRVMAGAMAAFSTRRTKGGKNGEWGFGVSASIGGAYGRTELRVTDIDSVPIQHYSDDENDKNDDNWNIVKLSAGLSLVTPGGSINVRAEEGRVRGNYGIWDAFHLGGLNVTLLPDGLDMNRVQQAALPGFIQSGDRMRRFRVSLEEIVYYERVAVWNSKGSEPEYLRVIGAELNFDRLIDADIAKSIGATPMFSLGVHRPLDGIMKKRVVVTFSLGYRL
jgi:hypothetical protein